MLALFEDMDDNRRIIVSADSVERLKFQIEMILESKIGPAIWAKLYVEMETVDLGKYQVALFETNSILEINVNIPKHVVNIDINRDNHRLSKG